MSEQQGSSDGNGASNGDNTQAAAGATQPSMQQPSTAGSASANSGAANNQAGPDASNGTQQQAGPVASNGAQPQAAGTPTPEPTYKATVVGLGRPDELQEFFRLIVKLEAELKMPVYLFCQGESSPRLLDDVNPFLADHIRTDKALRDPTELAVLIHSPGGDGRAAYHLGTTFARRAEGFVAVIPYTAKSAATLISLGAKKLIFGRMGELGPLDAQMVDLDKEQVGSALDEVQSLERLHKFAMDAFDQTLMMLKTRTRKKYDKLLPVAGEFVIGLVRPLFESVDVVHYTSLSRTLKVAEDYAIRLMEPTLGKQAAGKVVNKLVSDYPEHGFVIDAAEAEQIGLPAVKAEGNLADLLDEIQPYLDDITAIGRVLPQAQGATP